MTDIRLLAETWGEGYPSPMPKPLVLTRKLLVRMSAKEHAALSARAAGRPLGPSLVAWALDPMEGVRARVAALRGGPMHAQAVRQLAALEATLGAA